MEGRITYAQKRIIDLVQNRQLRRWCLDNGLPHVHVYNIGRGKIAATYKSISSMSHLIPPVEWLFYTDEPLPYPPEIVPQWDSAKLCKFIVRHRNDFQRIAVAYNLPVSMTRDILFAHRIRPSLQFMRTLCAEADPIEFFTDDDSGSAVENMHIPGRGEIINVNGNLFFVLTTAKNNRTSFVGFAVTVDGDGIALPESMKTRGIINTNNMSTVPYGRVSPFLVETVPAAAVESVMKRVRKMFE